MNKKKITEILMDIMRKDFEEVKCEKLDDNLIDRGMNSITAIKLIVKVEEIFEFEFYDEDLLIENFSTLNAMIDYVYKRLNEKSNDIDMI